MWLNDGVPSVMTMCCARAASAARSDTAMPPTPVQHLLHAGLLERHTTVAHCGGALRVVVDAQHAQPAVREADGER